MDRKFPRIVIDRDKLRNNCTQIVRHCEARGIAVAGVIKGAGGLPEIARLYRSCGAAQLATSRLEQMELWRREGIPGPYMLLRVPGLSELPEVARLADYSLQSDATTLDALNSVCAEQGVTHRVIVMADLGDLREGFWDKAEMVEVCCHVEQGLDHLHLAGVGVNLGCYGAVKPTPENMEQLVDIARAVEARIGRRLEIVSGGATSSYTLVHWGTMPQGINHLRIGETALLAKDLQVDWGISDMDYLLRGTMRLEAEIIELRKKPTHPVGETVIDAFGNRPTFVDRGMRLRALAAFGRADVGQVETLLCREPGMTVIGGSSDHCILDVEDCPRALRVGDVVSFDLSYSHMLYATGRTDIAVVFTGA
jgi:predicted amino acid racemase